MPTHALAACLLDLALLHVMASDDVAWHGAWRTAHGTRRTAHGARRTAHGARRTAHIARRMAHGARRMAQGSGHMARGTWHDVAWRNSGHGHRPGRGRGRGRGVARHGVVIGCGIAWHNMKRDGLAWYAHGMT
eukprot:4304721-Lingulodinium_polyedra.AAC.1